MKISVSTLSFYPMSLDSIFIYLTDLKISHCEIINEYPHDIIEKNILDSYDIQTSLHAPISDINLASHNKSIRNSSISEIKKSIDTCVETDSEVLVVHPGHEAVLGVKLKDKIFKYNFESLNECSIYANDRGVKLCVENMPNIEGFLYKDLKELETLVLDINSYITLDIGHAHNNNYTVEEMLGFSRIEHIHLSDNDGSYDSHNTLGSCKEGGINFNSLIKGLKQINYNNLLVIEVEHPQDVNDSLNYLKKKITT